MSWPALARCFPSIINSRCIWATCIRRPLATILDRAEMNPVLHAIRVWGPSRHGRAAQAGHGYGSLLPTSYIENCICDACYKLLADPQDRRGPGRHAAQARRCFRRSPTAGSITLAKRPCWSRGSLTAEAGQALAGRRRGFVAPSQREQHQPGDQQSQADSCLAGTRYRPARPRGACRGASCPIPGAARSGCCCSAGRCAA